MSAISTLMSHESVCWFCSTSAPKLKACAECRIAKYCNAECQKSHWRAHKPRCLEVKELKKDKTGRAAMSRMFFACAAGNAELVSLIVETGIDVNTRHPVDGTTFLTAAANNAHPDVVKILLSRGADPNILSIGGQQYPAEFGLGDAVSKGGLTSLHYVCTAMRRPQPAPIGALGLQLSLSLNIPGMGSLDLSNTPKDTAKLRECASLLLGAGANPNEASVRETTPFILACANGDSTDDCELVSLMMDYGGAADENPSFPTAISPLIMAAGLGNLRVCRTMIARGANPKKKINEMTACNMYCCDAEAKGQAVDTKKQDAGVASMLAWRKEYLKAHPEVAHTCHLL